MHRCLYIPPTSAGCVQESFDYFNERLWRFGRQFIPPHHSNSLSFFYAADGLQPFSAASLYPQVNYDHPTSNDANGHLYFQTNMKLGG